MSKVKHNIILFCSLFIIVAIGSCSHLKRSDTKAIKVNAQVIKGNYEISKVEKTNSDSAQVVCIVYDKWQNIPLHDAVVQIDELNIGGFTDSNGVFMSKLPYGVYTIKATNGGKSIQTTPIRIKPKTKITIQFQLGATIIQDR